MAIPQIPQPVRNRIAAERAAGRTLADIADRLTRDQIPTARGGRWHAGTISRVLKGLALDAELADIQDGLGG